MKKTEEEKELQLQEKKQKLKEKLEELKVKLERTSFERTQRTRAWVNTSQTPRKKTYLYQKLKEEYEKNFVIPELEKKKQKLENIRSFHQPINKDELDEHAKLCEENLKLKLREKRSLRKNRLNKLGQGAQSSKIYNTKFMKNMLRQEKDEKNKKELEKKELVEKRHKMGHYAKIVKEMHWPQVSPSKQREMELLIKKVERGNKPSETILEKARASREERNNYYVSSRYSKRTSLKESAYPASDIESLSQERAHTSKRTKVSWKKFKNPMIPAKPKPKPEPVVDDYLLKQRIKRQEREQDDSEENPSKRKYGVKWQQISPEDLSDPEK